MAKILAVDDSDIVRSQVRKALEGGGYQVVEAVNGIDGLEKAKMESGMTGADIAALDRAIVKLKLKKAEKEEAKSENRE